MLLYAIFSQYDKIQHYTRMVERAHLLNNCLYLIGYSRHEILGHNYEFLNGPDTEVEVLHQVDTSDHHLMDLIKLEPP